ncbi:hypothetical protein D9757_008877 [Collybiopsis confluens]|uniref:Uncharacterized protein n=1 Tax=Collybiopsis confluens TaxID=2823264 RepID=A0A8H5M0Y5_9AGAR|nr:hypothetical protein D9757_008877 [Collybiopsis confluens]
MSSTSTSPPPSVFSSALRSSADLLSTAASSPPPSGVKEEEDITLDNAIEPISLDEQVYIQEYKAAVIKMTAELRSKDVDARFKRLDFVLEKSAMYSQMLKAAMDDANSKMYDYIESNPSKSKSKKKGTATQKRGRKRAIVESDTGEDDDDDNEALSSKRRKISDNGADSTQAAPVLKQPSLVTGAILKPYQLEGVQWMASMHNSGFSGILADEMGLGKASFPISSAHLRSVHFFMPFLIVCPLSVLQNWVDEYAKFAPDIPVCMYHGTPSERAALRRDVLRNDLFTDKSISSNPDADDPGSQASSPRGRGRTRGRGRGRRARGGARKSVPKPEKTETDDDPEAYTPEEIERALKFPVVVTTYEMIIKDRTHLSAYSWGYIVVDEGHRLKNLDCRLTQEIKKYPTASRMILTGTPLHNNLSELWSLLNFVLPDIFNDVDSFQAWFNIPMMQQSLGTDRTARIIDTLHAILKPFLLRRLKADVETDLPPKKEYVLYAPLSVLQRVAYDEVLNGTLRAYLMQNKDSATDETTFEDAPRKLRSRGRRSYVIDEDDDDEYFEKLEKGEIERQQAEKAVDLTKLQQAHQKELARKKVNNMKLQNTVMQLRKVCSHPFLFDWPLDPKTLQPILNDELVSASGKMMVLDRLLSELFKRKHKVLLFSQFTTMLDIIEDWARELKGWVICRIDGSCSPGERREQMMAFQNGGDAPGAPHLFLLSTRAGGLGINLVAADTVIFYDQDWNPQMDAQAQDRAHRIGQTKPVLVFRLVSAHTIETKIMQRASEKRQLEALVIAKGKFKKPTAAAKLNGKNETIAEMAASLLRLEGEQIDVVPNTREGKANVLSDKDLDTLLNRSPEVFTDRRKGWTSADARGTTKTAFAVYEAPNNEGNDALTMMLGGAVE